MGLKGLIEGWIFKKALKKGAKAAGALIVSAAASAKVIPVMTQLGVTIDPVQLENGLTVFGAAALTMGLNWAKLKTKLGSKYL